MPIKRGDLFWVDLNPIKGSEQAGHRPVVVIQNDIGNDRAATTIIAPVTTRSFSKEFPTNVLLSKGSCGLPIESTILLSQIRTIDKNRLGQRIGVLPQELMHKVDKAIKISLALA